jgi:hypothetical protein
MYHKNFVELSHQECPLFSMSYGRDFLANNILNITPAVATSIMILSWTGRGTRCPQRGDYCIMLTRHQARRQQIVHSYPDPLSRDEVSEMGIELLKIVAELKKFTAPLIFNAPRGSGISVRPQIDEMYEKTWNTFKSSHVPEAKEEKKRFIRAQGFSADFVDTTDFLISKYNDATGRSRSSLLMRILISLRLAVHLSPDEGREIYLKYDLVFDPRSKGVHPALIRAYEEFRRRRAVSRTKTQSKSPQPVAKE